LKQLGTSPIEKYIKQFRVMVSWEVASRVSQEEIKSLLKNINLPHIGLVDLTMWPLANCHDKLTNYQPRKLWKFANKFPEIADDLYSILEIGY